MHRYCHRCCTEHFKTLSHIILKTLPCENLPPLTEDVEAWEDYGRLTGTQRFAILSWVKHPESSAVNCSVTFPFLGAHLRRMCVGLLVEGGGYAEKNSRQK